MPYSADDAPSPAIVAAVRAFANARGHGPRCIERSCARARRCRGDFYPAAYLPGVFLPLCLLGEHGDLVEQRTRATEEQERLEAGLFAAAGLDDDADCGPTVVRGEAPPAPSLHAPRV
jgi:hypothetical protein